MGRRAGQTGTVFWGKRDPSLGQLGTRPCDKPLGMGNLYRRYGPDTEIQYRPRKLHGPAKPSGTLSKREADAEFQYRPHIIDTDTIADAVFADAMSQTSKTSLSLLNSTVKSPFCPVCPPWGFVPGTRAVRKMFMCFCLFFVFFCPQVKSASRDIHMPGRLSTVRFNFGSCTEWFEEPTVHPPN